MCSYFFFHSRLRRVVWTLLICFFRLSDFVCFMIIKQFSVSHIVFENYVRELFSELRSELRLELYSGLHSRVIYSVWCARCISIARNHVHKPYVCPIRWKTLTRFFFTSYQPQHNIFRFCIESVNILPLTNHLLRRGVCHSAYAFITQRITIFVTLTIAVVLPKQIECGISRERVYVMYIYLHINQSNTHQKIILIIISVVAFALIQTHKLGKEKLR